MKSSTYSLLLHRPRVAGAFCMFVLAIFGVLGLNTEQAHAALVGHYTFDSSDIDWEAGSGQIRDVSGSGNHGTAYNLTVSNEVTGQIGGALQFNGLNTYINIPATDSFPPSGNAARTVCMWFKPTLSSWTPSQAIFGYGTANGLSSFGIDMDSFPFIQFYTYGYDLLVGMGIADQEEDWLQICWVWNGVNTSLLYSNGVLRQSQAFGDINTTQTDVYIGTSIAGDGFFPGIIDDVRIYDTALTDEEIQELYGEGAINITNIASTPGETTTTVTWDTTAEADSTVWYGTSSGSYTASTSSASLVTKHSLGLTGLTPATLYYFIVVSTDDADNTATSTEQTFTTTSAGGSSNSGSRSSGGVRYCTDTVTTSCRPRIEAPVAPVAPSCSLALYPTLPIRLGAQNDPAQVRLLEQFLNQFENAGLPVDGVYSAADEAAVKAWQEKYASEILAPWGETTGTGYVFTTSLAKIRSIFLAQCSTSTATTSPAVRDLTAGMEGEDVRALQALLIGQSYAIPAGATGYFASQTQAALARYQSANGISPAAGYFGAITRAHMKAAGLAGLWW